jgi:hypothetical protein
MNTDQIMATMELRNLRSAYGHGAAEEVIAAHLDKDIWRQIENILFAPDYSTFDASYYQGQVQALSLMFYNNDQSTDTQEFFTCMFEALTELKVWRHQ